MGGSDETFDAAISYVATRKLAYLHIMDGLAFGFHNKGQPYTMARVRNIFSKADNTFTALMGNCGHTFETANKLIADGDADLVAFGRPTLNNPDLPQKFASGAPLNADIPVTAWNRQKDDDAFAYTKIYENKE